METLPIIRPDADGKPPVTTIPNRLITTYLEMRAPDQLRAAVVDAPDVEIRAVRFADPAAYRALYTAVGGQWHWRDRLDLTDDALTAALERADVYVMYVGGETAGYIELTPSDTDSVEIAYFGLLPRFIGRGLGKYLLSEGVRRAWESGARRVWLHTCNLDGPAALANYLARGFEITRVEDEPMPDRYR